MRSSFQTVLRVAAACGCALTLSVSCTGSLDNGSGTPNPGGTDGGTGGDGGTPSGRVQDGLQVLYTFEGQAGSTLVEDVSGVGTPYDLTIQDPLGVQWNGEGLVFQSATVATNPNPISKVISACSTSNEISLEIWVKALNLNPAQRSRIMTVSADPGARNFDIGQEANAWDVRLRTTDSGDNGNNPSTTSPAGSVSGAVQHVVYTREGLSSISNIYIDGQKQIPGTVPGITSNWDPGYGLHIGNESTLDRPFQGQLSLAAVYCRALTQEEVSRNFAAGY